MNRFAYRYDILPSFRSSVSGSGPSPAPLPTSSTDTCGSGSGWFCKAVSTSGETLIFLGRPLAAAPVVRQPFPPVAAVPLTSFSVRHSPLGRPRWCDNQPIVDAVAMAAVGDSGARRPVTPSTSFNSQKCARQYIRPLSMPYCSPGSSGDRDAPHTTHRKQRA